MPVTTRQIDNVDVVPRVPHEPPPWPVQVPRAPLDWRAWIAICTLVPILLLVGYWLFADAVREWYRFDGGDRIVRWAFIGGLVFGALFLAKRLLLIEQPGGYRVPAWQLDARPAVTGMLEAQREYAANATRNVGAWTYSPTVHYETESNAMLTDGDTVDGELIDPLDSGLKALPPSLDLEYFIDTQPGAFSVPIGQDQSGTARWMDIRKSMLHAGIYGGTGAGKENEIESWFVALTRNNGPDKVQFAILDGKGHWMQPMLAGLSHMWMAPAGGIGEEGQAQMHAALRRIQAEAQRRGRLVFGANCDTMERYVLKTGDQLPYIVVVISDVMGNIVGDVDKLIVDLVSKARALGMRVVVSMQTPTKQNTQWRSNLSTVLCGQMQGRNNDTPALGIAEADMLYPPSRLPNPQTMPGIFSVRAGHEQWLIRAPLCRRDYWAMHIDNLPTRAQIAPAATMDVRPSVSNDAVLRAMMAAPPGRTADGRPTQERMRAYLKALANAGKSREYARQWAESRGLQFENKLWTEVRKELGLG
jgi:hypothetical protein